jgi:deoxyhypusine synthase
MKMRDFMQRQFRHFNARETREAAQAWVDHLDGGGRMLVTLGGAMSTAELGISLAEMIRQDKVHGICCTGANLEEDIFNLVAHEEYRVIPGYRDLSPEQEVALAQEGMNRVTDTCIPETVMRDIDHRIRELWQQAERDGARKSPWGFMCDLVRDDALRDHYQVPSCGTTRCGTTTRCRAATPGCSRRRRRGFPSWYRAGRTRRSATSSRRT